MNEKAYHNLILSQFSFMYTAKLFLSCLFLFVSLPSSAQEINFGTYSSAYSVTVSELNPGENLEFGTLIVNEGVKSIPLANSKVLTIEGVRYLDVIVDITADNELLLNGNLACIGDLTCSLPFTLQASYANRNANDISQAVGMTVNSNVASAQFAVLQRGSGPPGPPPRPVTEGYNPAAFNSTAYLYIYGFINVGNAQAGSYTSNITITVNYD